MVANASCAGAMGGWPRLLVRYHPANSRWSTSAENSSRWWRRNTNNLALRIRFTVCSSDSESSTGGCQSTGCICLLLDHMVSLWAIIQSADARLLSSCLPRFRLICRIKLGSEWPSSEPIIGAGRRVVLHRSAAPDRHVIVLLETPLSC